MDVEKEVKLTYLTFVKDAKGHTCCIIAPSRQKDKFRHNCNLHGFGLPNEAGVPGGNPTHTQRKHASSAQKGLGQICIHDLVSTVQTILPLCRPNLHQLLWIANAIAIVWLWLSIITMRCGGEQWPTMHLRVARGRAKSPPLCHVTWLFHLYEWYSGLQLKPKWLSPNNQCTNVETTKNTKKYIWLITLIHTNEELINVA